MMTSILQRVADELSSNYGDGVKNTFLSKYKQVYPEDSPDKNTLIPITFQISKMNNFWRERMHDIPNSIEVRSWLEDMPDADTYMDIFSQNWMSEAIRIGALNDK